MASTAGQDALHVPHWKQVRSDWESAASSALAGLGKSSAVKTGFFASVISVCLLLDADEVAVQQERKTIPRESPTPCHSGTAKGRGF